MDIPHLDLMEGTVILLILLMGTRHILTALIPTQTLTDDRPTQGNTLVISHTAYQMSNIEYEYILIFR